MCGGVERAGGKRRVQEGASSVGGGRHGSTSGGSEVVRAGQRSSGVAGTVTQGECHEVQVEAVERERRASIAGTAVRQAVVAVVQSGQMSSGWGRRVVRAREHARSVERR